MATTTYRVNVEAQQALKELDRLNNKVEKASAKFGSLRSAIGGLAIGAFVGQSIAMADAMTDLSDTTELSIASILGFSKAVAASGGSFAGAQKGIEKFGVNIGKAKEGNKEMREQLESVGISLDDLANKSNQELFKKTLDGVAKITDSTVRMATSAKLFGKEMAGVNISSVAGQLSAQTSASRSAAESMKVAGEAADKFGDAVVRLQEVVLKSIQPVLEAFNSIPSERLVATAGLILKGLLLLGGGFVVFKTAKVLIDATSLSLALFQRSMALSTVASGTLGKTFLNIGWQFKGVSRDLLAGTLTFEKLRNITLPALTTRLSYLGLGLLGLVGAFATVTASVVLLNEAFAAITGVDPVDSMAKGLANWTRSTFPTIAKAIDDLGEKMGMAELAGRKLTSEQIEIRVNKIQSLKGEHDLSLPQADTGKTLGLTDEEKALNKAAAEALAKLKFDLTQVVKGYKEVNAERTKGLQYSIDSLRMSEKEKAVIEAKRGVEQDYLSELGKLQSQYDEIKSRGEKRELAQLPLIMNAMNEMSTAYAMHTVEVGKMAAALADAQSVRQFELFQLSEHIKAENDLMAVQNEIATMTMTAIQKKYYDIEAAAKASGKAAIEAEEARRGSPLSKDEAEAYYAAAKKGSDKLKAAQTESYNLSRTYATGWKKAINEYVEAATDGATQAQKIFQTATQGMEDAIINFAKTGKFEMKELLQSIVEQMMRADIQRLFAGMFSGGSGGSKPATSGSSGGGWSQVLGSLFGGFFANGGDIPRGKFGIVGERGREVVTGPATVTPMDQVNSSTPSNTYVTYEIHAVDARSFQQLVAQNPEFIHAVSMKGQRSLTGAR